MQNCNLWLARSPRHVAAKETAFTQRLPSPLGLASSRQGPSSVVICLRCTTRFARRHEFDTPHASWMYSSRSLALWMARMQNPDGITHRNEKQFCPHLGNDNDKIQWVAIGAIAEEWPGVKAALRARLHRSNESERAGSVSLKPPVLSINASAASVSAPTTLCRWTASLVS